MLTKTKAFLFIIKFVLKIIYSLSRKYYYGGRVSIFSLENVNQPQRELLPTSENLPHLFHITSSLYHSLPQSQVLGFTFTKSPANLVEVFLLEKNMKFTQSIYFLFILAHEELSTR